MNYVWVKLEVVILDVGSATMYVMLQAVLWMIDSFERSLFKDLGGNFMHVFIQLSLHRTKFFKMKKTTEKIWHHKYS